MSWRGAPLEISVERPFGTLPAGSAKTPTESGPERDRVLRERLTQANDLVLLRARAAEADGRFTSSLTLPGDLPWKTLTVRVQARDGAADAQGVRVMKVESGAAVQAPR